MIGRYTLTAAAILVGFFLAFVIFETGRVKVFAKKTLAAIRRFPSTKTYKYGTITLGVATFALLVFLMTGCDEPVAQFPVTAEVFCGPEMIVYLATGSISQTGDRLYFRNAIDGKAVSPAIPCQVDYLRAYQ